MDEPAGLLARDPALAGHGDAAVQRRRRLVGDERAPQRGPGPPGLVLAARLEAVHQLGLDALFAQAREPAARLRIGIERPCDDAANPGGEHGVDAGRRRARDARTAPSSRRAWRRAPARPPPRARRPRRGARPSRSRPRRRSRRPRRRPLRSSASDTPCRPLRAPMPAPCPPARQPPPPLAAPQPTLMPALVPAAGTPAAGPRSRRCRCRRRAGPPRPRARRGRSPP